MPCPLCVDAHLPKPWLFKWSDLEAKYAQKETEIVCSREPEMEHRIQISDIAPDLAMLDFDSRIVDLDEEVEIGKVCLQRIYQFELKPS